MSWCQDYKQVFYLSISLGLSPSCLDVSVILFLRFIDILKWQHTLQSTSRQGGVFITSICTAWPQSQQWVIYLQTTIQKTKSHTSPSRECLFIRSSDSYFSFWLGTTRGILKRKRGRGGSMPKWGWKCGWGGWAGWGRPGGWGGKWGCVGWPGGGWGGPTIPFSGGTEVSEVTGLLEETVLEVTAEFDVEKDDSCCCCCATCACKKICLSNLTQSTWLQLPIFHFIKSEDRLRIPTRFATIMAKLYF